MVFDGLASLVYAVNRFVSLWLQVVAVTGLMIIDVKVAMITASLLHIIYLDTSPQHSHSRQCTQLYQRCLTHVATCLYQLHVT